MAACSAEVPQQPSATPPAATREKEITLVLRGVHLSEYRSVRLTIDVAVDVAGEGQLGARWTGLVELVSAAANSQPVLRVPVSASAVHATISFGSVGTWATSLLSGSFDARSPQVEFDVSTPFDQRSTIEIDFDVADSLVLGDDGGYALLPELAISF